jgi:hypothetical protein
MPTDEFITRLFYRIDVALGSVKQQRQAKLYPRQGYVKVRAGIAPIKVRGRRTEAAQSRTASAIWFQPCQRHRSIHALRTVASTRGAPPVCIWLRSSPNVTSRT